MLEQWEKKKKDEFDSVWVEGVVEEVLLNIMFCVKFDMGYDILVYISGKMWIYYICILFGDCVVLEISFYDILCGCIVYCC